MLDLKLKFQKVKAPYYNTYVQFIINNMYVMKFKDI